jgi:hypothetical protein
VPSICEQVDIAAPPQTVWTVLSDVSLLPELSGSTTEVVVDGPLREIGQTFEQMVRLAGRKWTSTWTVDQIEPGRRLDITGELVGGVPYRMEERLETLSPDRTRLVIEAHYDLPLGALGRLASRLGVERRARTELRDVLDGVARLAGDAAATPAGRADAGPTTAPPS